ncbi:MAG: hypothetical protein ABIK26_00930 [Candidatus Omnitrophota bacterium]
MKCERRGSILFVILWILAILSVLAVSLGYNVRQKIGFVSHLKDKDEVYLISLAGLNRAIVQLKMEKKIKEKKQVEYDSLKDSWSNSSESFKEIPVGKGSFSINYQYTLPGAEPLIRFGIMDEERKININKAEQNVISLLFQKVCELDQPQAGAIADSIIDWRDLDEEPLSQGAESNFYQGLESPYKCKNAPFEAVEELLLVKGMGEEIFSRVKDYITVYTQGKVNINTVSFFVLYSLGLGEELINKIIEFRFGSDAIEASSDDNVFTSALNIISELSAFCDLSFEEEINLNNLIVGELIAVSSDNFMIKSEARLDKKNIRCKIICVFEAKNGIIKYVNSQ